MLKRFIYFLVTATFIASIALLCYVNKYQIFSFFDAQKILKPAEQIQNFLATSTVSDTTNTNLIGVIKIPSSTAVIIEYDQTGKTISEWAGTGNDVVINGGYFNEDYSPSGFLVVNKKRIGDKIFDQDKSGLIEIKNGKINIRDLNEMPIQENEEFEFALQSYPFLIKNYQPALESDSGKKARRSALGIDENGDVYLFVADFPYLSLYEFMNEIIKTGIKFSNVINLDGGPSTGIYVNTDAEQFFIDSYTKVPSIIRFLKTVD